MGRYRKTTITRASASDRSPDGHDGSAGLDSLTDRDLGELVDAVVAAIDTDRAWEVERVASALQPFGGADMFVDELRLNGAPSSDCPCRAEGWL